MNHASLFSGIGGFDLASEWMDWNNIFHCEWNDFGKRILKYYWPKAISYGDITKTDFTIYRGKIDILTGGFPCQPYSSAGKRKGKEDERHLWPEMLRAIREIQPNWIVGENVFGLVNWNGGLVFEEVQTDLEAEGYEVQAYVLPACAVNAPHRRDRVCFVAYKPHIGTNREKGNLEKENGKTISKPKPEILFQQQNYKFTGFSKICSAKKNATNTNISELQGIRKTRNINKTGENREKRKRIKFSADFLSNWENFPTQSPVCNGDDGFSSQLDGITFPKWRNESIKAGGNAIVPRIAHQIFKAIAKYENNN